jgi:hypothetical protein
VRRYGYFVAEAASIDDLVAFGVDLATLTDEDDSPGSVGSVSWQRWG